MTLKGWTVAAGLVLLAPCAPYAATEANFGATTTGDLAELCAATPDNAIVTAAVPNPPPTRNDALSEFVTWARASPDRMARRPRMGCFGFWPNATPTRNRADQTGLGIALKELPLLAAVAAPIGACADMTSTP